MKSNIECHYKDGSLVFCTTHSYSYNTAHEILNVFNVLGLVSKLRTKSSDLFGVVGRLHVDYDPFQNNPEKWRAVVSELVKNKAILENRLESFNDC